LGVVQHGIREDVCMQLSSAAITGLGRDAQWRSPCLRRCSLPFPGPLDSHQYCVVNGIHAASRLIPSSSLEVRRSVANSLRPTIMSAQNLVMLILDRLLSSFIPKRPDIIMPGCSSRRPAASYSIAPRVAGSGDPQLCWYRYRKEVRPGLCAGIMHARDLPPVR